MKRTTKQTPREKAIIRSHETIKPKSSQKPGMAKAKKDNGENGIAGIAATKSS